MVGSLMAMVDSAYMTGAPVTSLEAVMHSRGKSQALRLGALICTDHGHIQQLVRWDETPKQGHAMPYHRNIMKYQTSPTSQGGHSSKAGHITPCMESQPVPMFAQPGPIKGKDGCWYNIPQALGNVRTVAFLHPRCNALFAHGGNSTLIDSLRGPPDGGQSGDSGG